VVKRVGRSEDHNANIFGSQVVGTCIELTVGGVALDGSKNSMGSDHGFLFQECDRTRRLSDQINYDYCAEHPNEDFTDIEAAFVRSLARVLPRLDLLGHTLDAARAEYDGLVRQVKEAMDDEGDGQDLPLPMTFDEFCAFAGRHPLSSLDNTYIEFEEKDRDARSKGRFLADQAEIARIPMLESSDVYWSERSYFGSVVRVLSPYSMLQVFGRNPLNDDTEVMWQYGPIVDAGWVDLEDFNPSARRNQTILVATEGTTDARILKQAIDLLCPDVADFFRFIDVDERHPFWGTGNLVKFAEGLVRIDVQNQVIFLLDNDAEGRDAYRRLKELSLPMNMRAMLLPDLDAFREFPARGPKGVSACDINGRAAAIESYLDLDLPGYPAAQVLWSNYKQDIDVWHGALEHKESYMRRFLGQTGDTIRDSGYDTSKLKEVLNALMAEATILASGMVGQASIWAA